MEPQQDVSEDTPIVCTLQPGNAADELVQLYRALFADAYVRGERTPSGVRWTFRNDDGIETRIRALADKERGCCAFLHMAVTAVDGEVLWDVTGPDNAGEFLDQYFELLKALAPSAS
jgi:hypothetical protein